MTFWDGTYWMYGALRREEPRPTASSTCPLLERDEDCYVDIELYYKRCYGLGVTAENWQSTGLSQEAVQRAMLQWRDDCVARVVLTDRRLLCLVDGEWLTFPFAAITEFKVELSQEWVMLWFQTAFPLYLAGPFAPVCALVAAYDQYGPDVLDHPDFAPLAG